MRLADFFLIDIEKFKIMPECEVLCWLFGIAYFTVEKFDVFHLDAWSGCSYHVSEGNLRFSDSDDL